MLRGESSFLNCLIEDQQGWSHANIGDMLLQRTESIREKRETPFHRMDSKHAYLDRFMGWAETAKDKQSHK